MDLISQFMESCREKCTFYENAGRLAAKQLETALQAAGIRAIVTSRVKNPGRLRNKAILRNSERETPYRSMKEIYDDMFDLAGVRVSLCFPGDRDKAGILINDLFTVLENKQLPEQSKPPTYNKRFSGYWANHYRIHISEGSVVPAQEKYTSVRVEIQVASVLIHAWSEMEHDLIYKPLQGTLSDEELSILDELNGLVLTGEIALERLQSAGNERIKNKDTAFSSQYDLASYLYNYMSNHPEQEDIELYLGNIELLFKLLSKLKIVKVKDIKPVLKSVKFEKDRRNISQQIIDQIVTGNEKRYYIYQDLRAGNESANPRSPKAIDYFFGQWVPLENLFSKAACRNVPKSYGAFNINTLRRMNVFNKDLSNRMDALCRTRNVLIHDIETPDMEELMHQGDEIHEVYQALAHRLVKGDAKTEIRMIKEGDVSS